MELAAGRKIEAPAEAVWDTIATEAFLQALMESFGVTLEPSEGGEVAVGSTWKAEFAHSLLSGTAEMKVIQCERPERLALAVSVRGLSATIVLVLRKVNDSTTRLRVKTDLAGKGAMGNLALSGLKVAKGTVEEKYRRAVHRLSDRVEAAI